MITFGSFSSVLLLALLMASVRGIIPVVEALEPLSSTRSTASEQQLIIKAHNATCGYLDGKKSESLPCL